MQGKILTFQASFEGVSKTLKGARWCADHSTKFMITLAKAAGLCNEKVVMAEKNLPFPSVQLGLFKEGFSQASVLSALGVCKCVVLREVKRVLLNQVDKKNTNDPMLSFFISVWLNCLFFLFSFKFSPLSRSFLSSIRNNN